jgi:hypothetical protein
MSFRGGNQIEGAVYSRIKRKEKIDIKKIMKMGER